MKARITVTDENGTVFEGEADLTALSRSTSRPKNRGTAAKKRNSAIKLDFSLNERAFIKKHAAGLGGPKQFVLLLAYLARGTAGKEIGLQEIHKCWNTMTAPHLLGSAFNRFYSTTAKEHGWVNTPKRGIYVLSGMWKEVFEEDNG